MQRPLAKFLHGSLPLLPPPFPLPSRDLLRARMNLGISTSMIAFSAAEGFKELSWECGHSSADIRQPRVKCQRQMDFVTPLAVCERRRMSRNLRCSGVSSPRLPFSLPLPLSAGALAAAGG